MKKITLIALFIFALTSVASAAPLMDFEKGKVAIDYTFRPSLDFSATGNVKGYIGDIGPWGINESFSISGSHNFDGDSNLELGLTFGIGNRWALQYRQYNPTGNIWSPSWSFGGESDEPTIAKTSTDSGYIALNFDGKIRSDEYNLLYSFNKNWAGFVGAVRYKGGIAASANGSIGDWSGGLSIPELWSEDKDVFHVGIVGSYKIAKKTNLWGLASFGDDYRNWEAGLSYDLGKDLQFNVSYRDTKFDGLKFAGAHITAPAGYESSHAAVTTDVTVKGWGFGLTYKF
jgi:opacity protein-like surface antigen